MKFLDEYLVGMWRTPDHVQELMRHGVGMGAITTTCPAPTSIAFNEDGDRYWPDDAGYPAWVMPVCVVDPERPELIETVDPLDVVSTGPVIDLVAFDPDYPGCWALRLGLATVLGAIEPQYLDPEPVPIHRDVTDWLRAECRGIMLFTRDPIEVGRILRQCLKIEVQHRDHAVELRRTLEMPRPVWLAITVRARRREAE
jgi:hypothetical protein